MGYGGVLRSGVQEGWRRDGRKRENKSDVQDFGERNCKDEGEGRGRGTRVAEFQKGNGKRAGEQTARSTIV
jgi:hypothetical protein